MSLGGGYSQSESEQKSNQFGPLGTASGQLRNMAQNSLFGNIFGGGALIDKAAARSNMPADFTTPLLSERGLTSEQEAGIQSPFQQAVQQALSGVSGAYARRGFTRPENIQAIAGSAAQNVAPQFANLFANLAAQNVAQRTQAPLIREDILRNRFADLLQALGLGTTAIGGEATSYGTSKSMGVQGTVSKGKE